MRVSRRYIRRLMPVLACVLATTSCDWAGRDNADEASAATQLAGSRPAVVQEDGRTIWRYDRGALSDALAAAPLRVQLLRVRGDDALENVGALVDVVAMNDGRMAVLDGMSDQIHLIEANGVVSGTWGGRGQGPNELMYAMSMWLRDGDLVVADHNGARVSAIGDSGQVVHRFDAMQVRRNVQIQGSASDSTWIVTRTTSRYARTSGGLDTLIADVLVLAETGNVVDSLGRFVDQLALLRATPELQTLVKLPYSPRGSVSARGDWIAIHDGLHFCVQLIHRRTKARWVVQFDTVPPPLSSQEYERVVAAALERVAPRSRAMIEPVWRSLARPTTVGAFSSVEVTDRGELWIGTVDAPSVTLGGSGAEHWMRIDRDGRIRQRFSLRSGERLLAIRDDTSVIAAARDHAGVESVVVYGLPASRRP